MPQFNAYIEDGRELMIRFTCRRCSDYVVEPLTADKIQSESYGHLRYVKKPEGWVDLLHGPLLCPKCFKAYENFMQNKEATT
jgi:hypothetical protein